MTSEIEKNVILLEKYVRNQNYTGYDPYDALNADNLNKIKLKSLRVFFTQLFVYSPINLRPFFHIDKYINPKALGLFLSSYTNLFKLNLINKNFFEEITSKIVNILLSNASSGFSGYCWGFNFNWNDIKRNAKKYTPTVVVSTFIGNGFLDLFETTHNEHYFKIAESITKFIINDIHIRKFENGICFSYSPIDTHVVHNANFLGAAFLSRIYTMNHDEKLLDYSKKAFEYSIHQQNINGSWQFQIDPETGAIRNQIDFHQGFIVNALCDFINFNKLDDETYLNSLKKAITFYQNNQFDKDGRALWRLPMRYPIDIHHQAQGIITFSKLYSIIKDNIYLNFSKKIAEWTIENMQNKKGYFYYQKWPLFTNKIAYMRWGQAWMMLALSNLLYEMNKIDDLK
jgi:rhamnogalacturonyl hydrolase YesR